MRQKLKRVEQDWGIECQTESVKDEALEVDRSQAGRTIWVVSKRFEFI